MSLQSTSPLSYARNTPMVVIPQTSKRWWACTQIFLTPPEHIGACIKCAPSWIESTPGMIDINLVRRTQRRMTYMFRVMNRG
jgi:hypothetical protein